MIESCKKDGGWDLHKLDLLHRCIVVGLDQKLFKLHFFLQDIQPFPKHSKTISPSKKLPRTSCSLWFGLLVRLVLCFFPMVFLSLTHYFLMVLPCLLPMFSSFLRFFHQKKATPTHDTTCTPRSRHSICSSRALGFKWPRKAHGRWGWGGWMGMRSLVKNESEVPKKQHVFLIECQWRVMVLRFMISAIKRTGVCILFDACENRHKTSSE